MKPPSSAEDSSVRPGLDEEDQFKGEDEAHFKSKKPTDSDDEDEEPPPPYTTYDPQEENTEEEKKDSPPAGDEAVNGSTNEEESASGGASPAQTEPSSRGVEQESTATSGASLLLEHPKLIPESSLGFNYQATSPIQYDSGMGSGSGDHDQNREQQGTRLAVSRSGSESDSSSKRATVTSPVSPTSLSRVSSPEKGRTLSDLTRITAEDECRMNLEARLAGGAAGFSQVTPAPPISSVGPSSVVVDLVPEGGTTPSTPELPNIPSSVSVSSAENSQGAAPLPSTSSSSSSTSSGLKFSSFLSMGKGKGKKQDKVSKSPGSGSTGKSSKGQKKGKSKAPATSTSAIQNEQKSSQASQSPQGSSHVPLPSSTSSSSTAIHSLKVGGSSSQPLTNSQESFVDGLSPELSECGDHSNEMDTSPRDAQILRAGYPLGMQVSMDVKNSCIVVKSVLSDGAVGRDGRIRVGDKIEAVNGRSLADLSLTKVKQILKKEAKGNEFTITYTPSPSPHFPLPSAPLPVSSSSSSTVPTTPDYKNAAKTPQDTRRGGGGGDSVVGTGGSKLTKGDLYYSQLPSMVAPLHDQIDGRPVGPGMPMHSLAPQAGGGGVMPPHIMQPPGQSASMSSWNGGGGGVSPYHQVPGYPYWAIDDQMGKPPPPYMFPHQAPPTTSGRMMGGQSPYNHLTVGNQAPPIPPGMPWQPPLPQGKK